MAANGPLTAEEMDVLREARTDLESIGCCPAAFTLTRALARIEALQGVDAELAALREVAAAANAYWAAAHRDYDAADAAQVITARRKAFAAVDAALAKWREVKGG